MPDWPIHAYSVGGLKICGGKLIGRLEPVNSRLSPTTIESRDVSLPPDILETCHTKFSDDKAGALANYIPELSNANPDNFGISLATIDGHVYDVGDSAAPFTIQSVSKAFVFAAALEKIGIEKVENTIGVEPSGEAFNSIRLNSQNRPFNPMVNAGAIACSVLIRKFLIQNAAPETATGPSPGFCATTMVCPNM